jgi:hypothetical protein
MARTIWKFPIPTDGSVQAIEIPVGAQILHAAPQPNPADGTTVLCLWAIVDPAAPEEVRRFVYASTGRPLPEADAFAHVATVQATAMGANGPRVLVTHILEVVASA